MVQGRGNDWAGSDGRDMVWGANKSANTKNAVFANATMEKVCKMCLHSFVNIGGEVRSAAVLGLLLIPEFHCYFFSLRQGNVCKNVCKQGSESCGFEGD